jgi:hypothetical protein
VGSAVAVGAGNPFIGLENFVFASLDQHHFPQWFFQVTTEILAEKEKRSFPDGFSKITLLVAVLHLPLLCVHRLRRRL